MMYGEYTNTPVRQIPNELTIQSPKGKSDLPLLFTPSDVLRVRLVSIYHPAIKP